jgi:hypothetical protein
MRHKTRRARRARRVLKRTQRRRQRQQQQKQRGGAGTTITAEEWARSAADVLDSPFMVFGDLVREELNLEPVTQEQREEAVIAPTQAIRLFIVRDEKTRREESVDLRDSGLSIRTNIQVFADKEDLRQMTPAEFRAIIERRSDKTSQDVDDTTIDALNYMLDVENGLRKLADRELINSLFVEDKGGLFLWPLIMNIKGEPEIASLYSEDSDAVPTPSPRQQEPSEPEE